MNLHVDSERVHLAHKTVRAELLAEGSARGIWVAEPAGSPVATATAVSALVVAHRRETGAILLETSAISGEQLADSLVQTDLSELIVESLHWLARFQNEDGGWGDCDGAGSNLAATLLVLAAFRLTGVPAKYTDLMERADQFVALQGGVAGVRRTYPEKSFAAAVLVNCALAGMVPWRQVPALPFEWLSVPRQWREWLRVPVARYGAPALAAVGAAKFHHDPPRNPIARLVRGATRQRSISTLERLQAEDGSFWQSTPLTAMIVMALAGTGHRDHRVVERGVEYLLSAVRADASWAIDEGMPVRDTALAICGLAGFDLSEALAVEEAEHGADHRPVCKAVDRMADFRADWLDTVHADDTVVADVNARGRRLDDAERSDDLSLRNHQDADFHLWADARALDWLLDAQHREPPRGSSIKPGGWGWSDSPAALPETEDTAAVLWALAHWRVAASKTRAERVEQAARGGVSWLLEMQNDDGGWPMFARGWGATPADLSAAELTAAALRSLHAWQRLWECEPSAPSHDQAVRLRRIAAAIRRGLSWLESQQRPDGSFVPVWFGNERQAEQQNPVVGTARVLAVCGDLGCLDGDMAQQAARWLLTAQHSCGGWGPPRTPLDYSGSFKLKAPSWRENGTIAKHCSVEETSLAVAALAPLAASNVALAQAAAKGLGWLATAVEQDRHRTPALVSFYFSRLWYHDRLYPLVFAASTLSRGAGQLASRRLVVAPVG